MTMTMTYDDDGWRLAGAGDGPLVILYLYYLL